MPSGSSRSNKSPSHSGHRTRLVQSEWTSGMCTGAKRKRQHRSKAILPKVDPKNKGNTEGRTERSRERRLSPYGIIWTLWIKSHLKLTTPRRIREKMCVCVCTHVYIYMYMHVCIYTHAYTHALIWGSQQTFPVAAGSYANRIWFLDQPEVQRWDKDQCSGLKLCR